MTRGQAIALGLLGVAVAATARFWPAAQTVLPTAPSPTAGVNLAQAKNPLPDLNLTTLKGEPVKGNTWAGKVVVANYWATWCAPCRAEMPEFSALHEAYAARGAQFLGITLDTAENVAEFAKNVPVGYPLLLAPQSAIEATVALGNGPQALPFTVIVDRGGKVAAVKLGRFHKDDLERELKRLL